MDPPTSTRSSSTTCSCPTTPWWAARATAGRWRSPPWPTSGPRSAATSTTTANRCCAHWSQRVRIPTAAGPWATYAPPPTPSNALNLRETLSRLSGHGPGTATSVAKVATGRVLRRIGTAALELAGPAALVDAPGDTAVAHLFQLPAELIGGGTMEIQLNIIATMILGLPRS
ncbi:acyl-CoA dehydrogenase family protein [Mycolicibacterium insubricum]|uniref:acyl-CoA dehydrogenase family protein n=1 Tax=Mycolicibacterium insubricum TaxID=444597 RepID=UPI0027E314CD|nr:acyl-CoA dehydrogenase family protein [Mycolicibacterium insubricum]